MLSPLQEYVCTDYVYLPVCARNGIALSLCIFESSVWIHVINVHMIIHIPNRTNTHSPLVSENFSCILVLTLIFIIKPDERKTHFSLGEDKSESKV